MSDYIIFASSFSLLNAIELRRLIATISPQADYGHATGNRLDLKIIWLILQGRSIWINDHIVDENNSKDLSSPDIHTDR